MPITSVNDSVKGENPSTDQSTSEVPGNGEIGSSGTNRTEANDGSEDGEDEDGDEDEDGVDNEDSDEDDSDETGEDEKNSKPSAAGDLTTDLAVAFSMNFGLKGNFAFASKLADAPNPGLAIAPLGLIGLPITERDAQSIKNIAIQAPFGHGDRLVVDTNVRHTWEIEPEGRISFLNPAWKPFVDTVAIKACTELGVPQGSKAPKCELYKLLLYETGSHFLPHQDTEKAPGMFATIVIVLPSFYTGGQVHVSHGSEEQVFDFSCDGFATCLLTWYADVVHEVKPIASGYRLALSYNLIQEENSFRIPSAPSASPVTDRFRNIFQKWSRKGYDHAPRQIAYVLDHQYSQVDLGSGEKALKGHDAQRVTILRRAAEEHGVAIGLAELECHVVGYATEDFGYGSYHKRMRCYYDEDDDFDDGLPGMSEEEERTTKISSLIDLDGNRLLSKGEIILETEELIPEDPFKGEEPDDQDYEGYQGNAPGSVEYWYHRVVVLLYLKADAHCLLLRAGGSNYAISQLKLRDNSQPTSMDRDFANYVIEHLNSYIVQRNQSGERDTAAYMLTLALRWKDVNMWLRIADTIGADGNLSLVGEFTAALELFGFDALQPLFEKAIVRCRSLKDQMEIIDNISRRVKTEGDKPKVSIWCDQQRTLALRSLKTPVKDDVPIYISVLKSNGMQFFAASILPQLAQRHSIFEFLVALVRALHEQRESFSSASSGELLLRQTIESCLVLAARQWKVPEPAYNAFGTRNHPAKQQISPSFARIKDFIDICFLTNQTGSCKTLFESLIHDTAEVGVKFNDYFLPLVPVLRNSLNLRNVSLIEYPFGDFFRYLIEIFLFSMLGPKRGEMRHHAVQKIGCGCMYCKELDEFLFSTLGKKDFRYRQKERSHLEHRLMNATNVVKFETIRSGSPYGLLVTKHAGVVAAQTWEGRQRAAKEFLADFGDAAIKLIMGTRYTDALKALSGEQAYTNTAKPYSSSISCAAVSTQPAQVTTTQGTGVSFGAVSQIPLVPTNEHNASASSNIAAGTKRKNLGFIDLCDSP